MTPVDLGLPGSGERQTALDVLRRTRALLDPALREWVHRLPAPVARVASYHFGWTDSAGRTDTAPAGKALRPALVLGCAEAVGAPPEEALAPAVAVEFVHNFSLLHDDILDGDTTRRHRATAWTVFGSATALLAGDALLIHAGRVLTEQPARLATVTGINWLCEATTQLIEGEHTDLSFEERTQVSLDECLAMTERKTAALLAVSCALGALWGGASPERTEALRRFGTHLGMAFQLADDLLGIWGDPAVTGKPAGADLASRKKSLPVVAALDSGTPAGRRLAGMYLPVDGAKSAARNGQNKEETAQLAALVEEAGGRAWAERTAEEQLRLALASLAAAAPEEPAGTRLTALAKLACHRDS
ncbi:polyprenyl synthetase family protein [Streptomyces litchfieldiae]|uniref:Polyprenyl synthetase family protein n=1 Tax=Streptomyces litchfieldiae TaxID=3075543 RepID=A0ABU2MWC9_9ACTN|nr:polyprenyl synthetase family protein [Streptomyces sp. DSM 44938]MDT0345613.1 polyprenyl synthetase family protein [Streptomyces sp. DSM 44938]